MDREWIGWQLANAFGASARTHEIEINNFQFDFAHYDGVGDEHIKNAIPVRSMFHFDVGESAKEWARAKDGRREGEREISKRVQCIWVCPCMQSAASTFRRRTQIIAMLTSASICLRSRRSTVDTDRKMIFRFNYVANWWLLLDHMSASAKQQIQCIERHRYMNVMYKYNVNSGSRHICGFRIICCSVRALKSNSFHLLFII